MLKPVANEFALYYIVREGQGAVPKRFHGQEFTTKRHAQDAIDRYETEAAAERALIEAEQAKKQSKAPTKSEK